MDIKKIIEEGSAIIGMELGSTKVKAVMIDGDGNVIAKGSYKWENKLENGIWTYSMDDIKNSVQGAYAKLLENVQKNYGTVIKKVKAIGVSAMMHGYLAFDKNDTLLVPFRTWRNTITKEAADKLTEVFNFNIPQRWSIAHLYQAILNGEEHVKDIAFFTTLAGFIHWKLTGKKVLGVGDASGMFPINDKTNDYDKAMIETFDALVADKGYSWKLADILPGVLVAGDNAGILTDEGAKLLDVSGNLEGGALVCPPEGDAGTGMAATNSVRVRTGNVSAGTSIFSMIVMAENLKSVHREIDVVTTPEGAPVAMVHCNNCTSEINAWEGLFKQVLELYGVEVDEDRLFDLIFLEALKGDPDCGGLVGFNYFSGEPVTGFDAGRPLFVRTANSKFNLPNFMRMQLFNALAALKYGMDILLKKENVPVDKMYGHGGYFTVKGAGQTLLSSAIASPVTVMETAGEGGAWGIALLALYAAVKEEGESLSDFLDEKIYKSQPSSTLMAEQKDIDGFNAYMENYKKAFGVEKAAVDLLEEK
jgi:sugar (pentulose or hexulose) kinase